MNYFKSYLQTITDRGNHQLAESIKNTVNDVAPAYLENFTFCDHEVGLLFGNVQSGKTGQMFGIIAAATDVGFYAFVILTTDNVSLQQQTIERVRNDLKGYCVCDEYDSEIFTQNGLMEPVIIVLKKNSRVLKQWSNILASTGFMKGNSLFIIDDEADAASLNTLVNNNRKSTINRYLDEIKTRASSSIYLQVTGTPQSILLQTRKSGWHPYFIYYFQPGDGYLGGDFFFSKETSVPRCIEFTDQLTDPLLLAIIHHLIVSAQILLSDGKVCNFLIHPSVRKAVHSQFENDVNKKLKYCLNNISEPVFISELKKVFEYTYPQKFVRCKFDDVYTKVEELLSNNLIKVLVMNGSSGVSSDEYATGSNILIGGNTLGRGITFPSLQTIYYTRTAKKPQADTMWQHSRMFGYDRDGGLMRVFIDEKLYKLFSDINSTNNSIISQVERGLSNVKIYYPEGISPTRKNVLDHKKVGVISGGTNYYPFNPENNTLEELNQLLAGFNDTEDFYQVSLRLMIQILNHISSDADFRIQAFVSIINSFLAEQPAAQGILIIRRNRSISKGTGALLSPNDWKLGATFHDKIVLTVYQMTGEKGWNGRKIWVPNIKLPSNVVYYDVREDLDELEL